jgi:predicted signal transduction protein with EAL and GGDEF domain
MDMVTRFGGEEIAVILPSTTIEDGKRAAERIRTTVAAFEFLVGQTVLRVTVSLGLAGVEDGDDCVSLVRRADEALYASKRAGRNCAHVHTEGGPRRIVFSSPAGNGRSSLHATPGEDDDPALKVACDDLRCRLEEVVDKG